MFLASSITPFLKPSSCDKRRPRSSSLLIRALKLEKMALATHQFQGSYAAFPPRPLSLNKVLTLKQCYVVGKTDKLSYIKHQILLSSGFYTSCCHHTCLLYRVSTLSWGNRVASPCFSAPRVKCLRISSIKGSAQNDESGESLPSMGVSETGTSVKEVSQLIKALWCHFWGLDAADRVPFMISTPLYLAIIVAYGSEAWILWPVIVTLYFKLLRGLCALAELMLTVISRVLDVFGCRRLVWS